MKTIELTLENQMQTIIMIDKIFEIKQKTPFISEVISIGGAKTTVNGTPKQIKKEIDKLFS